MGKRETRYSQRLVRERASRRVPWYGMWAMPLCEAGMRRSLTKLFFSGGAEVWRYAGLRGGMPGATRMLDIRGMTAPGWLMLCLPRKRLRHVTHHVNITKKKLSENLAE
jgi:hypothetical protein